MNLGEYLANIILEADDQSEQTIALFPGAFKPPHKGHFDVVEKLLKASDKKYIENPLFENEQHLSTNVCGYFVLYIIFLQLKGLSPKECLDHFRNDILHNEKIIRKFGRMVIRLLSLVR